MLEEPLCDDEYEYYTDDDEADIEDEAECHTLMVITLCFFYFVETVDVNDFKHQSMKSGVRMTTTRPSSRATRCRMFRSGRTPPGGRSSSWSSPRPTLAASPSPSTRRWSECTGRDTFYHLDVWAWALFSYTEPWDLYYSVYVD